MRARAQDGGKVPFSNATEFDAWSSKWCDYCRHDHGIDHRGEDQLAAPATPHPSSASSWSPRCSEAWREAS